MVNMYNINVMDMFKRMCQMLEENLDFEGVDEICGTLENLPDIQDIIGTIGTFSISAPLK